MDNDAAEGLDLRWRKLAKTLVNNTLRPVGLQIRALVTDEERRIRQFKQRTPSIIHEYLDSCSLKILQIAAGPDYQAECYRNWLNSDIANPVSCGGGFYSIYMKLAEAFPISHKSFD